MINKTSDSTKYKPAAQIEISKIISKYASASMDTSDGLISTLDQLMRLNDVGFEITEKCEKIINDEALIYSKKLNIPSWLLLAGQHGEFELVFTIPQNLNQKFLTDAERNGFYPLKLGKVIQPKEVRLKLYSQLIPIDSEFIRNLPSETKGDVNHYLKLLLEYDSELKQSHEFNFTTN